MKTMRVWVWVVVVSSLCAGGLIAQQTDSNSPTSANNVPAASQPVPRLIMFSGTVKDLTGKPLTGPVDLNFAIYKEQADAAPLWQESQTLNVDEQGHYTALLGAMQPEGLSVYLFTSGEARWLGVSAGSLPEQPRTLLVSVPYALKAGDASTLGGKPASAFALAQPAAGTAPATLAVGGATGPGRRSTPEVGGTGTQNYIPLWTDGAGTLGNSVIYQSGSNIGIGTTAPGTAVDVYGANAGLRLRGTGTHQVTVTGATSGRLGEDGNGVFFSSDTKGAALRFATNNGSGHEWMRINPEGNVGIGTAAPGQKLTVAGIVESTGGGFKFPDGTTQTSAASGGGGGGTVTRVDSGAGLAGGPITTSGTLSLDTTFTDLQYARLGAPNTFTANQTVPNLAATTGVFSGSNSSQIVSVTQSGSGTALVGAGGSIGVSGSGSSYGVYGVGDWGVYGVGNNYGVIGDGNYGVYATGVTHGVYGRNSANGSYGRLGTTVGGDATGVYGSGDVYGVYGSGDVYGVYGSGNTYGVHGMGGAIGVKGYGTTEGVFGEGGEAGVWGWGTTYGVYGQSGGYAGYFQGNVSVTGTLTSGTKDFLIDHPLDAANKYLYHSSVESSEMMNIYRGNVVLDAGGEAVVQLPDWFESLNTDFGYQLTAIGAPGPNLYIAQEVQGNSFRIAGGSAGMKVSWQVTGVRQDAYAKAHPLEVEVDKPEKERGYYIHPELYGQPKEKGIDWARHPQQMHRLEGARNPSADAPKPAGGAVQ